MKIKNSPSLADGAMRWVKSLYFVIARCVSDSERNEAIQKVRHCETIRAWNRSHSVIARFHATHPTRHCETCLWQVVAIHFSGVGIAYDLLTLCESKTDSIDSLLAH